MDQVNKKINQLEINQLSLSLEKLRRHPALSYLKMAESITSHSQLVPVIVVSDVNQGLVLVDGYLRVRALQKLGTDLCNGEIWECDLATALLLQLAGTRKKHLEAIELIGCESSILQGRERDLRI